MKAEKPFQACSTGASLPPVGVRAPPRPQRPPRPHAHTRGALAPRSLPPAVSSQRTAASPRTAVRARPDGIFRASGLRSAGALHCPCVSWGAESRGGGRWAAARTSGRFSVSLPSAPANRAWPGARQAAHRARLRETRAGGGRSPCRQSKDAPLAPAAEGRQEGTGMEAGEGQQREPAPVPSHGGPVPPPDSPALQAGASDA